MATTSTSVSYYRRFAERILGDIDLLSIDLEFVRGGGRVLTATDFSELYAYAMNASESFLSKVDLQIIDQVDNVAILHELHQAIMMFYLFESDEPLWLLDSYVMELRRFLHTQSTSRFQGTVRSLAAALRQYRSAKGGSEFSELQALVSEASAVGRELSRQERRRVLEYFENVMPAVVAAAQDQSGHPADRLRHLMREGRLLVPADVPPEIAAGDEATFDRWYANLKGQRPDKDYDNSSDARAIASLYATNRWLMGQERKRRIVLLTRSESMHRVMRKDASNGRWNDAGGNALRHPRAVLALLDDNAEIVRGAQVDRQERALLRWRRMFEPIADASAELGKHKLTSEEVSRRHIAVIANVWRRYCGVSATKLAVERNYLDINAELKALSFFVEPTMLHNTVRERLDELERLLSSSHFVFATIISPEMEQARRVHTEVEKGNFNLRPLRPPPTDALRGPLQILSAHGTPMPFRITLRDARITTALRQDASDPFRAFQELAEEYMLEPREGVDAVIDIEVEWYVAVAYVCAALGAWGATRRACEFVQNARDVHNLEAALLLSRAIRHLSENLDDLTPVADYLRELAVEPSLLPLDSVRLFAEQLKYQFIVVRRALDIGRRDIADSYLKRIMADLEIVDQRTPDTTPSPEACELINNVVYHSELLNKQNFGVRDEPSIREYFEILESRMKMVYGDELSGWPDNFVDTYCWVRLQLINSGELGDVDKAIESNLILRPLRVIATREYVSDIDIADFRSHAQEAERYFGGANT